MTTGDPPIFDGYATTGSSTYHWSSPFVSATASTTTSYSSLSSAMYGTATAFSGLTGVFSAYPSNGSPIVIGDHYAIVMNDPDYGWPYFRVAELGSCFELSSLPPLCKQVQLDPEFMEKCGYEGYESSYTAVDGKVHIVVCRSRLNLLHVFIGFEIVSYSSLRHGRLGDKLAAFVMSDILNATPFSAVETGYLHRADSQLEVSLIMDGEVSFDPR